MQSTVCTLVRQDANQPWGFRLQGGRNYGRPLTVHKISPESIAERRNLRLGDTILQIGRERTVDMTHEDAQDAVLRSGNRLDLLVLRPIGKENRPQKIEDQKQVRAVVHSQYNSPLGLYSAENIKNTLISQAEVLTNSKVLGAYYKPTNTPVMKRSDVYRMVQEEEEEETTSSSPSPTYMRRQPPPQAPPKPVSRPDQRQQHYQPAAQPQHHQPQAQHHAPQQQQHYQPQTQQQAHQQQHYQPQRQQQQPQQQQYQAQKTYQQPQQQNYQPAQDSYGTKYQVNAVPQTHSKSPSSQQTPSRPGPTFQSNIPVQSSTQDNINEIHWTTRRGLPVWPPQASNTPIPTSSQSVKWGGSAGPSKKFIWPPPKDYVEVTEEYDGDQRRTVYTHVKDPRPNPARVLASSRDRTRLEHTALEPYSQEYREPIPQLRPRAGRPVRHFFDVIYSNSTRLPPTYRAPPGTLHMAT